MGRNEILKQLKFDFPEMQAALTAAEFLMNSQKVKIHRGGSETQRKNFISCIVL